MHDLLSKVLDGVSLTQDQAEGLLRAMIAPGTPAVQVAAALAGLRAKGESAEELAGFARGMRAVALDPKLPASDLPTIDIVGTGGDGAQTLNISTAAALLVAATGRARVAKHGNRAISSSCGSADVLAALGVPVPLGPKAAGQLLQETGFTFLFAPHYHPAMASVQGVRRELGQRTIFNMLGPLTNPARPDAVLIGAYSPGAAALMHRAAGVLRVRAQVVYTRSPGGCIDEITAAGACHEVIDSDEDAEGTGVLVHEVGEMGLPVCAWDDLRGKDASFNAQAIRGALAGEASGFLDSVLLTATHALGLVGVQTWQEGMGICREAIDSGRATALLARLAGLGLVLRVQDGQEGSHA